MTTLPTPAPQQIAAPFNFHETIVSGSIITMSPAFNVYNSTSTGAITCYLFPIADVPDGYMLWVKNIASASTGTIYLVGGTGTGSTMADIVPGSYSPVPTGSAVCLMATRPASYTGGAGYPWIGLVKPQ
jgi:hypothetical protein